MALADLRALARRLAGTPGTGGALPTGSGAEGAKGEDFRRVPSGGTRGTPGTPKNDNVGGEVARQSGSAVSMPTPAAGVVPLAVPVAFDPFPADFIPDGPIPDGAMLAGLRAASRNAPHPIGQNARARNKINVLHA